MIAAPPRRIGSLFSGYGGLDLAAQLKAIGNGVVPQQAAAAFGWLLAQHHADLADRAGLRADTLAGLRTA